MPSSVSVIARLSLTGNALDCDGVFGAVLIHGQDCQWHCVIGECGFPVVPADGGFQLPADLLQQVPTRAVAANLRFEFPNSDLKFSERKKFGA